MSTTYSALIYYGICLSQQPPDALEKMVEDAGYDFDWLSATVLKDTQCSVDRHGYEGNDIWYLYANTSRRIVSAGQDHAYAKSVNITESIWIDNLKEACKKLGISFEIPSYHIGVRVF